MFRYLIYFTIAIFAFGLGVFVAFNFHWRIEKEEIQIQEFNEIKVNKKANSSMLKEEGKKITLVCEDKVLKPIWQKMMDSQSFKDYVDIDADSTIDKLDCTKEFEVRLVDVNDDGTKEIAVQGRWEGYFCGMYSGCSFWLFKKDKKDYQSLLSYENVFDYKLGKKKRSGFRDLILTSNSGHYGIRRYFYQFNGAKYKAKRCYLESFNYYDRNGQLQTSEKLNITFDDCPKEEN